jgi:WD40 repeat protein/serine/threonine protein kinase
MIISTSCPNCGKKLNAPDVLVGQTIKCPKCRAPITVAEQPTLEPTGVTDESTIDPAPAGTSPASPKTQPQEFGYLAPPQAPDEIGRLGPYRILKVLGAGGMGVVFQAEDINLRRTVALKAMKPEVAANPLSVKRFLREARTAASIEHDHIVTIYRIDEDRGVPYLAMQFLRGESLESRLHGQRKLPLTDIIRIGKEIARGLGAAHDQGLIHRDIKPANIWLEANTDRVKIVDFGLAREADGDGTLLTQPGAILGTPAYMAPEQARADPVDARCDLYSLGCVLYRMSTGRIPFTGKDTIALLLAVTKEAPRPIRDLAPELPLAFADLVMRLLSKRPADRPPTAKAVIESLEAVEKQPAAVPPEVAPTLPPPPPPKAKVDGTPSKGIKITPSPTPKAKPKVTTPTPPPKAKLKSTAKGPGPAGTKRGGGRLAIVVVLLLVLLGVAAYWFKSRWWPLIFPPSLGVLKVESDERNLRVIVLRQGQEVRTLDLTRETPVSLEPGEYEVRLAVDVPRRTITPNRFTLPPGGTQVIHVRGQPLSPAALVREPAFVHPEVISWTLETSAARGPLYRVAYRNDGLSLAAAGADGTVRIWEVATGRLNRALLGHAAEVVALAWSPVKDSPQLATAGRDQKVLLWNTDTGQLLRTLNDHEGPVHALAWSPDGTTLASAATDGVILFWDVSSGNLKRTQKLKDQNSHTLAWSPDGKTLAFDQRFDVQLCDAETGDAGRTLSGHTDNIFALAWSPDGKMLASAGQDKTVRLWEPTQSTVSRTLGSFTGWVNALAWSPDSERIAAVSEDWGFRRWYAHTGKLFGFTQQATGPLQSVAWSPHGKTLALAGHDGSVRFWDNTTGKIARDLTSLPKNENVLAQAWAPDGKSLAIGEGNTVRIRAADTGQLQRTFPDQPSVISALAWSPDGTKLALGGSTDGSVTIWNKESGSRLATASEAHTHWVRQLAWSPDKKTLASSGLDSTVRLWNAQTGKLRFNLRGHTGSVRALAWSPDGKKLVSGGQDATVQFWDASTGKQIRQEKHTDEVNSLAWSPDGTMLASGSSDQTIQLWSMSQVGKPLRTLREDLGRVFALSWQPDGLLSLDQNRKVHFWDASQGKVQRVVAGASSRGTFSPDGSRLASWGGIAFTSVTRLWESGTGQTLQSIVPLYKDEYAVIVPDGTLRGSDHCTPEFVVVVRTGKGTETLTLHEFARKYSWKNFPNDDSAAGNKDWTPLFNGKDLTGWKVQGGKSDLWGVEREGGGASALFGKPGGGWLVTEREYSDFELCLEYKLAPGANSGVTLRAPLKGNLATQGLRVPLIDAAAFKGLPATQISGAIFDVAAAKPIDAPAGQWHRLVITAVGRKLSVTINGTGVLDANLDDYRNRSDKYPGLLRDQGHIGLQSNEGRVEFRKVEVRDMSTGNL